MDGPICLACCRVMRCANTGVDVHAHDSPHHLRRGDVYACPGCGARVLTSLGASWYGTASPGAVVLADEP
jgi:hypothetical protein